MEVKSVTSEEFLSFIKEKKDEIKTQNLMVNCPETLNIGPDGDEFAGNNSSR